MASALLVLQLAVTCPEADATLQRAAALIGHGDETAATAVLASASTPDACATVRVADIALRGWRDARAAAAKGGAAELLPAIERTLSELRPFVKSDAAVEVEYAETAIRAAVAAAQDERPELELRLTHARDLAERLQLRGGRAVWPRSFNLLAGELWFEVDRYEEARRAYERAVGGDGSALALVGLARTQARLGAAQAACATYERAVDAAPALRALARGDLARCR